MTVAIAYSNMLYKDVFSRLCGPISAEIFLITDPNELTLDNLTKLKPKYIFFSHWSYMIPKDIYQNFECVIFHMTDLPFGRGGSPLQNLIARGIYQTQITALKCTEVTDGGAVYLKKPLSLYGAAEEIYLRASTIVLDMIQEIMANGIVPKEQVGVPTCFKRRTRENGDIRSLTTLTQIFDYIRMLDAEGYPPAFLETEHFRVEFSRASIKKDQVLADVKITLKKDTYE